MAIGLLALFLAARHTELGDVLQAWGQADPLLLGLALALVLSSYVATAIRWRALLYPHRLRSRWLSGILLVSRLAGSILPWKLGTLVRSWLVTLRSEIGLAFALGSVLVERVLDLGIVLMLFLIALPVTTLPDWLRDSGLGIVLLFVPIAVLFVVMVRIRLSLFSWVERRVGGLLAGRLLGFVRAVRRATHSLPNLPRRELAGQIALPSLWLWASGILTNYVTLLALGIRLPFLVAVVLLLAIQLGTKLPGPPADIGVFHYVAVLVLSGFGVNKALALSYAFVLHAIVYLLPALLGACVLVAMPRILGFETLGQVVQDYARLLRQIRAGDSDG